MDALRRTSPRIGWLLGIVLVLSSLASGFHDIPREQAAQHHPVVSGDQALHGHAHHMSMMSVDEPGMAAAHAAGQHDCCLETDISEMSCDMVKCCPAAVQVLARAPLPAEIGTVRFEADRAPFPPPSISSPNDKPPRPV